MFFCEYWEVFQITSFIEHLWETTYFMYKMQNFNHQIQLKIFHKCFSSILYKHETLSVNKLALSSSCKMPTCKLTRKTLPHIFSKYLPLFYMNTSPLLLPKSLWNCASSIYFTKYKRKVLLLVIYLFNYDSSKSIFFMLNIEFDVLLSTFFVKQISIICFVLFYKNVIFLHHRVNNFLFFFEICIKFALSAIISTMKKW